MSKTVEGYLYEEFIFCHCGCGFTRSKYNKDGSEGKYIWKHQLKDQYGENNPAWKDGKSEDDGYILIRKPDHHFARNGYVQEHRLVYEEYYKCCLLPWAIVHHKNEKRHDNRIKNLELMNKPKHVILHKTRDLSHRRCLICNTNVSRRSTGTNNWYKYKDGYICKKCYMKMNWRKYRYM